MAEPEAGTPLDAQPTDPGPSPEAETPLAAQPSDRERELELGIILALYWAPLFFTSLFAFLSPQSTGTSAWADGPGQWIHALRNVGIVGVVLWIVRLRRQTLSEPFSPYDLGIAFFLFCASCFAKGVVGPAARIVFPPGDEARSLAAWTAGPLGMLLLTMIVSTAAEEVVMRGFLQTRLTQLGAPAFAVVGVSAVLQASYHLYQGVAAVMVHVAGFLAYAALYQWKRRLWPIWFAHFAFDLYLLLTRARH